MNPKDYIRAVRRRWFDVALAVAVAVAAGFFVSSVAPPGPVVRSYEATSVLLESGNQYSTTAPNVGALAELTTVGEVPNLVAKQLGGHVNGADLAASIKAEADSSSGIVKITSTASASKRAKVLANAFAKQLVSYVRDLQAKTITGETGPLQRRLDKMQTQIDDLDRQIAQAPPLEQDTLQQQRDALVRQYGLVYESYQQLASASTQQLQLTVIPASSAHQLSSGGIEPPRSRTSRVILAAILGLIIGIILVLVLDRFDGRIRTSQAAARAFGRPVLAEVPALSRRVRKRAPLALIAAPRSIAADAFRTLALQLSMPRIGGVAAAPGNGNGHAQGNGNGDAPVSLEAGNGHERAGADAPKVVAVVSAGPGDGKTTVAANLAAAFAYRGKRVLVLSCDFRRPKIHRLFGCANTYGFAEALGSDLEPPLLKPYATPAARVERVWVVPSGPPPEDPGELLSSPRMAIAMEEARRAVDVVVIDTAPLLTTSDAADLLSMADGVVVVARAGRTTNEIAERTMELATRLNAPITGIVLNAVTEMSVPRRYYYYRYYRREARPKKQPGRGNPQLVGHSTEG
jgi:capsular exopolysaccharide synthesis family protein